MSYTDYNFGERLMELRVHEEARQAELRRLQRKAQRVHQGWLSRQSCWLLCQFGSLFVAFGARLWQAGLPQSLPAGEPMLRE
jgi:hypothetical protein